MPKVVWRTRHSDHRTSRSAADDTDLLSMVTIRKMVRSDVESAGKLLYETFSLGSTLHGFAPRMESVEEGIAWAWTMLRRQPNEINLAEIGGEIAGFLCVNPRGKRAGLGPLAVHPRFQGKGIARQLMQAGIAAGADRIESYRTILEAFNPVSFALMYSVFEFVPVGDVLDLSSPPLNFPAGGMPANISAAKTGDLEELCSYDEPLSGFERRPDFKASLSWGKILVYRTGSQIRGILACLPNARSVQLGPMVADGVEEALGLIHYACRIHADRTCSTRVLAKDQQFVSTLLRAGWRLYCPGFLMVRGKWSPGKHLETLSVFPEAT